MKKSIITTVLFLLAMSITVSALWRGNMVISGDMTATSGNSSDYVTCDYDIDIQNSTNYTVNCMYNNTGIPDYMTFTCNLNNLSSTNENCTYELDSDIITYLSMDDNNYTECLSTDNVIMPFTNGTNNMSVRFVPSPYRCPLTGTYIVNGTF